MSKDYAPRPGGVYYNQDGDEGSALLDNSLLGLPQEQARQQQNQQHNPQVAAAAAAAAAQHQQPSATGGLQQPSFFYPPLPTAATSQQAQPAPAGGEGQRQGGEEIQEQMHMQQMHMHHQMQMHHHHMLLQQQHDHLHRLQQQHSSLMYHQYNIGPDLAGAYGSPEAAGEQPSSSPQASATGQPPAQALPHVVGKQQPPAGQQQQSQQQQRQQQQQQPGGNSWQPPIPQQHGQQQNAAPVSAGRRQQQQGQTSLPLPSSSQPSLSQPPQMGGRGPGRQQRGGTAQYESEEAVQAGGGFAGGFRGSGLATVADASSLDDRPMGGGNSRGFAGAQPEGILLGGAAAQCAGCRGGGGLDESGSASGVAADPEAARRATGSAGGLASEMGAVMGTDESGATQPASGIIFGCTSSTFDECFALSMVGLPRKYLPLVKSIVGGYTLIFLFNFSNRQLHGVYACSTQPLPFTAPPPCHPPSGARRFERMRAGTWPPPTGRRTSRWRRGARRRRRPNRMTPTPTPPTPMARPSLRSARLRSSRSSRPCPRPSSVTSSSTRSASASSSSSRAGSAATCSRPCAPTTPSSVRAVSSRSSSSREHRRRSELA